ELVKLEQFPIDREVLANIFPLVHTINGPCGFVGLPRLEALAHAGEDVLGKMREGELEVTPEAVTLIFESFDGIKEIMASLEATESEPEGDDADLIRRLNDFADEKALPREGAAAPTAEAASGEPSLDELEAAFAAAAGPDDTAALDGAAPEAAESLFERIGGEAAIEAAVDLFYRKVLADDAINQFFDGIDIEALRAKMRAFLTLTFDGPANYDGNDLTTVHAPLVQAGLKDSHFNAVAGHLRATLDELGVEPDIGDEVMELVAGTRDAVLGRAGVADEAPVEAPAATGEEAGKAADDASGVATTDEIGSESSIANQTIRVNVELLENLMNLVSELVLSRNQLMQMLRGSSDSEFEVPLQRLSHVTTDLQEGVMKTRMQPIGNAWAKLPRIVRDLSIDLGKKIDLEMRGADTELDRQVLELIKDPLTHMVRNSGDHGLESPAERRKAGKPETGKIVLNAFHEGGHIIIEISDDGHGIAIEKVKVKALSQGLASAADLDNMSDQQVQQFIFNPGFSTATKVTNVSGRGVGLDVVRTNIEKIGGTVELVSKEGRGSTFTIKIPLTLAIVSALIVEAAGERFAIPQIAVNSLVRASGTSEHKIETINDAPVLRQRDRLLPLVSLGAVLHLEDEASSKINGESDAFVVVTQVGNYAFGIIVDRVFDTEEIVVKPVAPILRHISMFSGNTILGDGSVIMILDPNGIAAATGEVSVADTAAIEDTAKREAKADDQTSLLVFRAGGSEPKAVPLALVARLEEVAVDTIESSNDRLVIQYRGRLMPLIKMDESCEIRAEGRQPILVFTDGDQSMGLVVDEIMDIVEARLDIELASDRPGRLGSIVVAGKATELIDTGYYLTRAFSNWFDKDRQGAGDHRAQGRRLLLVDDSPFFRNLLKPLLTAAGYKVTTADSGDVALEMCEQGENFDIIISDIEMPGMDGFEFVEAVRQDTRWHDTPVVALSSYNTPDDFDRGREAGFSDYVTKSDRDALLNTISQTLSARASGGAA
ncbi:MAG: chemotaxis protein CheW, partial [Alphaproteobacteria bacterium]|nr:chemotaxis protein CheW [Alphaproteobacteria bacterium]